MRKETKELILIFLINATNNICNLWGPTFPYIASYANHHNAAVTMNYLFGCMLFLFLGNSLGNFILPTCYELFGLRYSFLLGAVIYFLNCMWFCSIPTRLFIGLNSIVGGITYQFIVMTTNLFFFEKYPQKAKTFVAISMSGTMVGNFIWSPLLSYIVNPTNEPTSVIKQSGDDYEEYFDISIAQKINLYLLLNGLFALVVTFIAWLWLEDPERYYGKLISSLKGVNSENDDSISHMSRKDIEKSFTDSLYNSYTRKSRVTVNQEDSLKLLSDLDNNTVQTKSFHENLEDKCRKELKSPKFFYIYAICFFRMTALSYYIDNFKVIGLYKVKDDNLINKTWGIAAMAGFLANFSSSFIWQKFEMINSYYLLLTLSLVLLTTFQAFGDNRVYFVCFGLLLRYNININRVFNYYTVFEIYNPEVAVQISKWFETVNTFGFVVVILLNDLLVAGKNFGTITWVYISSLLIGIVLVKGLSIYMEREKALINDF